MKLRAHLPPQPPRTPVSSERIYKELTGKVERINEARTSLLLSPPGEWFRISKFAAPSVDALQQGHYVTLGLDSQNFVRVATLTGKPDGENGPPNQNLTQVARQTTQVSASLREARILRQTALKCAVDWATQQVEDFSPESVCGIAEVFLGWLAVDEQLPGTVGQERG